jgi:hypothetical protein
MNKYFLFIVLILPFILANYSKAQDFFPVSINDEFQVRDFELYADNYSNWTEDSYPDFTIADSVVFNGMTFLKFRDKYLAYDSTNQKLYIYINGGSKLAADFNLPDDSTQVFYYQGYPRTWKSDGISYQNILGALRPVYSMKADTSYWSVYQYQKTWKMKFAAGVGFYQDFYYEWKYDMGGEYTTSKTNTLVFSKIDTNIFNIYNQGIQLDDPVRNRLLSEFPYYLYVTVTNPLTGLFSNYSAEYNIFRNDTLISSRIFPIDTSINLSFININHNELLVGDKIQFKCILEDSSIFNNIFTAPDSGYYTFYVVSDTATSLQKEADYPFTYFLSQNFPNPFNPTTNIKYEVGSRQFVTLKVYDVLGNKVATLVNEEKSAGIYTLEFNADRFSSGVYFYKLQAGNYLQVRKMLLLK